MIFERCAHLINLAKYDGGDTPLNHISGVMACACPSLVPFHCHEQLVLVRSYHLLQHLPVNHTFVTHLFVNLIKRLDISRQWWWPGLLGRLDPRVEPRNNALIKIQGGVEGTYIVPLRIVHRDIMRLLQYTLA